MKNLEISFPGEESNIGAVNETTETAVGLYQQRKDEQSRLKKVNRKIHKLQAQMHDIYCLDKADRKRKKQIKRKIKKYKAERKDIKSRICNIEQRLARVEDSISLIKFDVVKLKTYYRQQLIDKMSKSDNPREIEGYLKLIEGGVYNGKQI